MDKTRAKEELRLLIEKYNKIMKEERDIKSKGEEMTKKDLIRPLFERGLGWNFEEDVTAEEKISKGWVDYGFRINGVPKFFLEAKALREDLDNQKFFEQAVNYAYYKRCPWAILTNFETVKILNAEWETPYYFSSHFMTIKCNEFLDRFEDLWLLSKESFDQGSLDKLAERYGKKTKKTSIDKQLLNDFTKFRDMLSKDITKRNQAKKLTQTELDESIQRILDRLIFIRNCEDRGLEEKKLWEARNEIKVWKKLKEVFMYYDKNYDSKLFTYDLADAKKVHLCDTLDVDDSVIREIIECLYRTKDQSISYDFSIIEADVLGTVYEQYLSHILKKTEKRATLTENHAHRKEQGIYYTPIYIVDYIVRSTLGELLKDEKINADRIRVLDLACGSGSFLIKAFDVLNEHYIKNDENYAQTQLDLIGRFTKKAKILQNNIFGVDLDKQAVEIAQLNLLLKIAEKGQRLPLLEQNIKCGNSLIDDEKYANDKAFKWEKEFSEIMKEGGFDVIIGNPPYVRQEEFGNIKPYLESKYETYQGTADLFVYFFERELKLLKENSFFGMIVSNKWLRAGYGKNLRKFLAQFWIEEFIDFGDLKVFPEAIIYPCIIIMKKIKMPNPKIRICKMDTLEFGFLENYVENKYFFMNQNDLSEKEWEIQKKEGNELLKKIRISGIPIEEYVGSKIYRGILTGFNEAFIIDENKREELIKEDSNNKDLIKPFLTGAESKRYVIKSKKNYILLTKIGVEIENYPTIHKHLSNFKEALEKRWDKGKYWYELRACAYYDLFSKSKIVWGNLATKSSFSLDETNGYYVNAPACILPTNSKYVLGILNSNLMSYFLKSICAERQRGFIEQKPVYVSQVPIKKPTETQENEITQFVDKMLQLQEKLFRIGDKLTDERARMEAEIKEIDILINELVYEIYGITEDEKKIIEESLK